MWNKKMENTQYFLVHTAITFALNKTKGSAPDAWQVQAGMKRG
jgi:hypothetical protein